MGNTTTVNNRRGTRNIQNSRYTRNSYSLQAGNSYFSNQLSRGSVPQPSGRDRDSSHQSPILFDSVGRLSQPQLPKTDKLPINRSFQEAPIQNFAQPVFQGEKQETKMKKSHSESMASRKKLKKKDDLSQVLAKLNEKNDSLRKQLIRISGELSQKLKEKKFVPKIKQIHQRKQMTKQEEQLVPALRRQLQNGYKQIERLKRVIYNIQKIQGNNAKNEDLLNQIDAKIRDVDWDISQIRYQVKNAKEVKRDQELQIQQTANTADFGELQPFKKQIYRLRKISKKMFKNQRTRGQKERLMQEYMFQLQRKKGKITGQYMPQIKSYANKNYHPDPKYQKKKDSDFANYQPADWQIRDVLEEIRTLKHKHEEYHIKMDKALKAKTVVRQQNQRLKKCYDEAIKQLQVLNYKKERYMQLVMGNLQFLMNEQEDDEHQSVQSQVIAAVGTIKTISKGNDIPEQVFFDDHHLMQNKNLNVIKIVSVNLWFTIKHQISAIQMIYFDGKDCFLGNKSANVTGEMEKEVLQLDEGDYIKNMMGIFNRKGAIEYLAFYSSKGKAKTFGKELINGINFTLGLTRRQRPVCMSGYTFFDGSYWRINKLTVDVLAQQ